MFMIFQLTLVASNQKLNLLIFFCKSCIEVVYLLHHGLFDQLSQFSHACDPVLCLSDQVETGFACLVLILAADIPDGRSEINYQLFETRNFYIFLLLDVFELDGKSAFNHFFHSDRSLQLVYFPFELLSKLTTFLLENLDFSAVGLF